MMIAFAQKQRRSTEHRKQRHDRAARDIQFQEIRRTRNQETEPERRSSELFERTLQRLVQRMGIKALQLENDRPERA
jgi:hypothetical protein